MRDNLIAWLTSAGLSFATTAIIYRFRKRDYPRFKEWWDAEGLPILILVCLVFMAFAIARGAAH